MTTSVHADVRRGWAVQIRRDDGSTFLACSTPGNLPAVWCNSNRKWAVAHKRELREQGFACKVVRVTYTDPVVNTSNDKVES